MYITLVEYLYQYLCEYVRLFSNLLNLKIKVKTVNGLMDILPAVSIGRGHFLDYLSFKIYQSFGRCKRYVKSSFCRR